MDLTDHEYTSWAGGKIVLPASCSAFRKRLRARKSLVRISSFNCASHESSSVAISKARRSFCSWLSFSTHFALSNLAGGAAVVEASAALAPANIGAAATAEVGVELGVSLSGALGEEDGADEALALVASGAFVVAEGEEKNEVMAALALGFLVVEVAISTALRFNGVAMMAVNYRD